MKKRTVFAVIATPIACAAAGAMIARYTDANAGAASGYCADPTVYVDMADNVSMVTGGADVGCDGRTCTVTGFEQVQVDADGQVQCVNVGEGQVLSLTRRSDGLSVVIE